MIGYTEDKNLYCCALPGQGIWLQGWGTAGAKNMYKYVTWKKSPSINQHFVTYYCIFVESLKYVRSFNKYFVSLLPWLHDFLHFLHDFLTFFACFLISLTGPELSSAPTGYGTATGRNQTGFLTLLPFFLLWFFRFSWKLHCPMWGKLWKRYAK